MTQTPFSILVVEDSPSDANLLHQIFSQSGSEQWRLVFVERLSEAIDTVQQQSFDLALLDLFLPDSDGLNTVIRFREAVSHVPVIVLTIANDEKQALQAINQGAQDFLIKGEITPQLLMRSIRYGIERGRLTRQLQVANTELEAFSYSVAHDLRAPLRAIEGFSQALLEDCGSQLNPTGIDYVNRIQTSATRLGNLIEDLLAYSRLSRAETPVEPVDVGVVISTALSTLEHSVQQSQAQILVEQPLPTVMAHKPILLQAFLNLISNAIKFVHPKVQPQIRIWAEVLESWHSESFQPATSRMARLWIEDNGIGIPEAQQERIFGVFERLHGSESYAGTGIGLAIARKAVEKVGGEVGVESQAGKGSRFWIDLPQAKS